MLVWSDMRPFVHKSISKQKRIIYNPRSVEKEYETSIDSLPEEVFNI